MSDAGMETVASVELERGDVFTPMDAPEDVVEAGDVFWKHPTQSRVKRVMEGKKGDFRFVDPQDLATQVYLDGAFKRATVIKITTFMRNGDGQERLSLPWR